MTDEEVHAIAALLRGNSTIAELNLRGNEVGESSLRMFVSIETQSKSEDPTESKKVGKVGVLGRGGTEG